MVANDTRLVPVVNEPANWKVSQGCLAVTTDQKTDFFQKKYYGFERDSGHFLGGRSVTNSQRGSGFREFSELLFLREMKMAMDYRVANLDNSVEISTAFLNVPKEATDKVTRSSKMLTSTELEGFTKDGTVNKWLSDFNKMFQDLGTVKDPMAPEKFDTSELFSSA